MNYGLELNNILEICIFSEEERKAFENFVDRKVYQDEKMYPNFEKGLAEISNSIPLRVIWGAYINLITLLNCPKLDWNLLEQQRARWEACQNTRQLEHFPT